MAAKADTLKALLTDMKRVPGVLGAAIISRDGIGAIHDAPPSAQQGSFAAMTAAMLGAAEAALGQLGNQAPHRMIVDASDARLLVQGITSELLLVVIAAPSAQLGALDAQIAALSAKAASLQ